MATLAHNPAYRKMTVEEFLELQIEGRAELEDGILYMMAGGSLAHAAIGANVLAALSAQLRGSGYRPFGPDLAVRTGPATVRLPDVSVYCGIDVAARGNEKLPGDPKVVVEILSPSTSALDQNVKANEYRGLAGVETILLIDPERRRVRIIERAGPEAWGDRWLPGGSDVALDCLGITLTLAEIFDGS